MKSLRSAVPFFILMMILPVSCDRSVYNELFLTVCTVLYDDNDSGSGSIPSGPETYNPGDRVTVLGNTGTLAKANCTFSGWNTRPDGSGTTYAAGSTFTMGNATVVLYALWTGNPYILTFYANDGSGSTAAQTINYGDTEALDSNPFTRAGYNFAGWTTASGGSTPTYADGVSYTMNTAGAALYAVWTTRTVHHITSAAELNAMRGGVTADWTLDDYYILDVNIDLSAYSDWSP
ncbi:MAG: InlB B-repeat-containing protein, partial [Spirochaetota bacterium]